MCSISCLGDYYVKSKTAYKYDITFQTELFWIALLKKAKEIRIVNERIIKLWITIQIQTKSSSDQTLLLTDDVFWPMKNEPVQFLIYIDQHCLGNEWANPYHPSHL